jgi:hypothetical protein
MCKDIYQERGFKNRMEYLEDLAEREGADLQAVLLLADLFGPSEDFDGLVSSVQDGVRFGMC